MCGILATPAITLLAALVEVLDLPSRGGSMMGTWVSLVLKPVLSL